MPQIFTPSADTWLRAGGCLLLVAILTGGVLASGWARSSYVTHEGWPVHQPVPFSHKHHAGDLGIDCRYCHADVETGPKAGLPPLHTCMTCHSQLWTSAEVLAPIRRNFAEGKPLAWTRVSALPDYVYFDHHIHVDRGVPCVECHGRVDTMPLTYRAKALQMQFCIDCHRNPAPRLRPPDQVTRMDWSGWKPAGHQPYGAYAAKRFGIDTAALTDCSTCHR